MNTGRVRDSYFIALLAALIVYAVALTFMLSDIQHRIGTIEHYIAHRIYGQEGETGNYYDRVEGRWGKYRRKMPHDVLDKQR